jgi:hypothetical protein
MINVALLRTIVIAKNIFFEHSIVSCCIGDITQPSLLFLLLNILIFCQLLTVHAQKFQKDGKGGSNLCRQLPPAHGD